MMFPMSCGADMNGSRLVTDQHKCATAGCDTGFSLVEILAAIALVGLMGVALLNAAAAGIRSSGTTDTAAKIETILGNAADRINRTGIGCPTQGQGMYSLVSQAAAEVEGWRHPNAVSTSYQHFVKNSSGTGSGSWAAGACPGGVQEENLVQLITVTVTSPDGATQRSIQVVKSEQI
jgi:prepilin-type N-terminal cleavage/methylation domain-containing protein